MQIRSAVFILIALFPLDPAVAADDPVKDIHELTLQWTGLAHQKDLLDANWRRDKPVLEQQVALLEREARELDALVQASAQEQDEVEQQRLALLEEQSRLEQEQAVLERNLAQAQIRLNALYPRLPPPLAQAWAEELPKLDDALATASEKLQLVLELLGQLDDFQQKITLNETVMTLEDGNDYLVRQVYLGVSHGWYVSADGQFAAAGRAGADGWQWTPGDYGQAVGDIIAILERRANPVLVSIPLQLAPAGGGN